MRRPNALAMGAAGLAVVASFFLGRGSVKMPSTEPALCASVAALAAPQSEVAAIPPPPQPSAKETDEASAVSARRGGPSIAKVQSKAAFDAKAAGRVLKLVGTKAAACKRPKDPHGSAVVTVTFDGSGRAASASVSGAPFADTPTATCISTIMKSARVPAFAGEAVTVKKTIAL
jgi:hypothetical protein